MKIAVLLCLALNVTLILGCGPLRGHVSLPNGYAFEVKKRQPFLTDPAGKNILPASQFMVSGSYVYGWIDKQDKVFFFLNTETGKITKNLSWHDLDHMTQEHNVRKFRMKDSITFWDVVSGTKRPNW